MLSSFKAKALGTASSETASKLYSEYKEVKKNVVHGVIKNGEITDAGW